MSERFGDQLVQQNIMKPDPAARSSGVKRLRGRIRPLENEAHEILCPRHASWFVAARSELARRVSAYRRAGTASMLNNEALATGNRTIEGAII